MTAIAETNQLERLHESLLRNAEGFRKRGEHLEAQVAEWYAARLAQAMKEARK